MTATGNEAVTLAQLRTATGSTGSGSGSAGTAGRTAHGTLFGLVVLIGGFLFLVVIIVIVIGIGLGKFLYVIPKTHFLFLLLYVHINTDVSWRIIPGAKNSGADTDHGAAIHNRVGEIVGHAHG